MIELFAIFDACAKRFVDPFPAPTMEVAIRGFGEACMKEGHQFQKFPEDYSLWHVGAFDPELGVITGSEGTKIAMATSYVQTPTLTEDGLGIRGVGA